MKANQQKSWREGRRVAIIGAGPGGVSAALAFLQRGFDVRLYERAPEPKPLGGAVLLSSPVLAILRNYGVNLNNFGSYTIVEFQNNKGKTRAELPFNPDVEKAFGIPGWHYGMLRENAFGRMMELLPDNVLIGGHEFDRYEEHDNHITACFRNGESVDADILVGADGINSRVSAQAFGEPDLFHIGLRVWLNWCDPIPGIPEHFAAITHSKRYQASYFPMLHDGKPGYEWWVVEPVKEDAPVPDDPKAYIDNILKDFADPLPRFSDATDFKTQSFPWNIYNRKSLKKWSHGRVVCVGDAVHPVSPYAAYGMGMAIEDGYFIARALAGKDLKTVSDIQSGYRRYESERVDYVNHQVEFARMLGSRFHHLPTPLAGIRDFVFDNTRVLQKLISTDYLGTAEQMSLNLQELHVN